jgi:hypothetical protein
MTQKRPLARDASEWALYANTSPFRSSRRIPPLHPQLNVPTRPFSPPRRQLLPDRTLLRETNRPYMSDAPSPSRRITTRWDILPSKHLTGHPLSIVSSEARIPGASAIFSGVRLGGTDRDPELRSMHTKLRGLTTPHWRFPRSSSILRGWPRLSTLNSEVIKFLKLHHYGT